MSARLIAWTLIVFILIACENRPSPSPEKTENSSVPKVVFEKEKPEQAPSLPPEVKIKLKRDGKDNYSWELSGSDADQVLRVNEKLKKKVGGDQAK